MIKKKNMIDVKSGKDVSQMCGDIVSTIKELVMASIMEEFGSRENPKRKKMII